MTVTEAEVEMIRHDQCPACKNYGFHDGPRGGPGQNIFCRNPNCRAAFNVAPRKDVLMAHRIGTAGEEHYPPKVHILSMGQPLCGFAGWDTIDNGPPPYMVPKLPDQWPLNHSWVGREEFELCTCPACRKRAQS